MRESACIVKANYDLTRITRLNVGFGQSWQDHTIDIKVCFILSVFVCEFWFSVFVNGFFLSPVKGHKVRVEDDMMASERVKLEEVCREQQMLNKGISKEFITVRPWAPCLTESPLWLITTRFVCLYNVPWTSVVFWTLFVLGLLRVWFRQTKVLCWIQIQCRSEC